MPECLPKFLLARKRANRLVDGQLKHVVDRTIVDLHLEHARLEASAAAFVTGDVDVGHEHHFNLEISRPFAGVAASTGDVEAESSGRISALAGERRVGEDASDL